MLRGRKINSLLKTTGSTAVEPRKKKRLFKEKYTQWSKRARKINSLNNRTSQWSKHGRNINSLKKSTPQWSKRGRQIRKVQPNGRNENENKI